MRFKQFKARRPCLSVERLVCNLCLRGSTITLYSLSLSSSVLENNSVMFDILAKQLSIDAWPTSKWFLEGKSSERRRFCSSEQKQFKTASRHSLNPNERTNQIKHLANCPCSMIFFYGKDIIGFFFYLIDLQSIRDQWRDSYSLERIERSRRWYWPDTSTVAWRNCLRWRPSNPFCWSGCKCRWPIPRCAAAATDPATSPSRKPIREISIPVAVIH